MRLRFVFLFCLLAVGVEANPGIDSLWMRFSQATPFEQDELSNQIEVALYEQGHIDSVFTMTKQTDRQKARLVLLSDIGNYFIDEGRYAEMIPVAEKSIVMAQKLKDSVALCDSYSKLGIAYFRLGSFDKALSYTQKELQIEEALNDSGNISSSLNTLGAIYMVNDKPDLAEACLKKAIAIERSLKRDEFLAIRLGMLSDTYLKMGREQEALACISEALALDSIGGREEKIAIRQSQMGDVYFAMKCYTEAEVLYTKALATFRRIGRRNSEAICLRQMGNIYAQKGQTADAEKVFLQCVDICQKTGNLFIETKAYENLTDLYPHDAEKALFYMKQYVERKDSLFSQESRKRIDEFSVQCKMHEKENQIALHAATIARQRLHQMILIVALSLVCLIVALAYTAYRIQYKRSRELARINDTKDKFFSIISHDLKTPLLAQQSVLKSTLDHFDRLDLPTLKSQYEMLLENSDCLVNLLHDLLDWAQLESGNMHFCSTRFDLYNSIVNATNVIKNSAVRKNISFRIEAEPPIVAETDRMMTETILHNLLSNAVKFSPQGSCIRIVVTDNGNAYRISVCDSGVGIAPERLSGLFSLDTHTSTLGIEGERGTGLGLVVCAEMAHCCGSDLKVESVEGEGSTFTFFCRKSKENNAYDNV
ncbi:MAG: tetratricopeptide repeat protein [Paludibacteraceae bacterium]